MRKWVVLLAMSASLMASPAARVRIRGALRGCSEAGPGARQCARLDHRQLLLAHAYLTQAAREI